MPVRLRILVSLLVTAVVFMVVAMLLTHRVSSCLTNALAITGSQFDAAHSLQNAQDRKMQACAADKETYIRMLSCVHSMDSSVPLYGRIMMIVIRRQGTLSRFVQSHNDLCPANTIAPNGY